MRTIAVQTGIMLLIAAGAWCAENTDIKSLLSESLQTNNEYEKLSSERNAATEQVDKKRSYVRSRIKRLKHLPFDEEKIAGIKDNLVFFRNLIARDEALIEIAKITDPRERAKLAEKYENDRKRLLAAELKAHKPFKREIEQLKGQVKDKQKQFEEAMKQYCLWPKSKYPSIAGISTSAEYHAGSIKYTWLDKTEKRLARAQISLKDKPVIKEDVEMLDGTYYISYHWWFSITVWTGQFRVEFFPDKPEFKAKEKIAGLVKDLVDLDGLAKIDPTRSDSRLNSLAKASLACSKRYRKIVSERKDATGQLQADRIKVKKLRSQLRKPPADREQLKKVRDSIDYWRNEMKKSQDSLEIGTITDPNKRAPMIAEFEAEKNKLDAENKRIGRPYDEKIRELRTGLKEKQAALDQAMKRYCLTGSEAYPDVKEISTKTSFYRGRVTCRWKDVDGKELCYAQLYLRNVPFVPEDARMLDGVYYISDIESKSILVWVGNFQIRLTVEKEEWQGEERMAEVLKHFIDLGGLAEIGRIE